MDHQPDPSSVLEEMKAYIERKVAQGFDSPDDISEEAVEVYSDEADVNDLKPAAVAYTKQAVEAHRREESTWPAETECDRLDAAFRQLEVAGIVARRHVQPTEEFAGYETAPAPHPGFVCRADCPCVLSFHITSLPLVHNTL